jgi:hypothetical protein
VQCTQHTGENYILEEVVAMPSAPSHAPESLLTHERRAAPADDNASAVLQRCIRQLGLARARLWPTAAYPVMGMVPNE